MNANDLSKLIQTKNNEMEQVLDPRVDKFVEQFSNAISDTYANGKAYKFAGCSRVGIIIEDVDLDELNTIEFIVDEWILAGGDIFDDTYDMVSYWDFIKEPMDKWSITEVSNHYNAEIYDMRYLVTEFEKRGFVCYVDTGNGKLIVVFEI